MCRREWWTVFLASAVYWAVIGLMMCSVVYVDEILEFLL